MGRKHLAWYSKGLPNSAEYRVKVNQLQTPQEVISFIHSFFETIIDNPLQPMAA